MTPAATHINLSISGATAAEILASARAFGGTTATSEIGNDELLAELRDRFAKLTPPMVIRVLPFSDEATTSGGASGNDNAAKVPTVAEKKAAEKAAADQQKAAAKAATDALLKEAANKAAADKAAAASKEPPKDIAAGTAEAGGDDWGGEADGAVALTVEDVKAALNAYSAKHGQVAARDIMKDKGGSMRLLDVPAEKFADLIEALALKEAA